MQDIPSRCYRHYIIADVQSFRIPSDQYDNSMSRKNVFILVQKKKVTRGRKTNHQKCPKSGFAYVKSGAISQSPT